MALIDSNGRSIVIDAAFCRAMLLNREQLLHAPVSHWVGILAFEEWVEPALQRCLAGEVVTHQLVLMHPEMGPRQFSVTYHPCTLPEGAVYCAMILRDVTVENLANDGYLLYSQWRDALNAIDRASLSDQPLKSAAFAALERLRNLAPYRQATVAVVDGLAESAGAELGLRTVDGLCVVASVPQGGSALPDHTATSLALEVQGNHIGELTVWPLNGDMFSSGQIEMMNELASRFERALQKAVLRDQLSRYTVDLEHTIAERTQEIERREERERLARELHDAVTQSIYSLTLFAEAGRRLAAVGQLERVQEYLTLLGDTAQQAMKQMRLMLYELRPAVLEQVGLMQALRQRLDAVERMAGIEARLEISEPLRLSPVIEEGLYRICQEALNNALKHASAHVVVVRLRRLDNNEVLLEVSDDGIGFVPRQLDEAAGLGLTHIRERAARLNAELQIETAPEKGTTIRVLLLEPESGLSATWPINDASVPVDWTANRTPEEGNH